MTAHGEPLAPAGDLPGSRPLLVIPARGGSRGLVGKNLRTVCGVSLVGHAVRVGRQALANGLPADARLVVDTDDPAIADEARRWGADVPFLRDADLARDDSTSLASTLGLVDRLDVEQGWAATSVVLLQPTSPLREVGDVLECWRRFTDGAAATTTVFPAEHPPGKALRVVDGRLSWRYGLPPARRQDATPLVFESGAVYVVGVEDLRARGAFVLPGASVPVHVPVERSTDIDGPIDLTIAETLYRRRAPGPGGGGARAWALVTSEDLAAREAPLPGEPVLLEVSGALPDLLPAADRLLAGVTERAVTLPPDRPVDREGIEHLLDLAALLEAQPVWSLPAKDGCSRQVLSSHGLPTLVRRTSRSCKQVHFPMEAS